MATFGNILLYGALFFSLDSALTWGVLNRIKDNRAMVFPVFNYKKVPLVNFIWIGVLFLVVGMIGVIYLDFSDKKTKSLP